MNIKEQLERPFSSKNIQWRVGSTNKDKSKGIALAYVDARAITDRLDEVFGVGGWKTEFTELTKGGLLCTLSVKMPDTGEWVSKTDGSDYTDFEAVKGGISGAIKRAAALYGVGKYLYDLPNQWYELKDGKYLAKTPVLPDEFLPEEERGQKTPIHSVPQQTQTQQMVDKLNKELKQEDGKHYITGKKHNNEAIEDVVKTDRGFVEWVANTPTHKLNKVAIELLNANIAENKNDTIFPDEEIPF